MVVVGCVPPKRARAAITVLAKVIMHLVQILGWPVCGITSVETVRTAGNVENSPVAGSPEGASGSSTTRTRLLVPSGASDHVNGGEIPSQVYCDGISPPGGIAGLANNRGMALSSNLPGAPLYR